LKNQPFLVIFAMVFFWVSHICFEMVAKRREKGRPSKYLGKISISVSASMNSSTVKQSWGLGSPAAIDG
jgi:hypothetical protein